MREVSDPTVNYEDYAVPVLLGGTAAATLAQAATNLKLVQLSQVGQANGPVGLDATGKVAASKFAGIAGNNAANVQGNFSIPISTSTSFVITDYDSFKSYTVSVSAGTITQNGDTLSYTAPSTPQAVTLTINGRAVTINVQGIQPAKPTLAAVDQAGSGGSTAALVLTGSAFAMNTTSANTHLNTDWQVASDVNFSNIASQSLADAANKVSWTSGNLSLTTTYYARVRYRDNTNTVGDWSNTVQITTKSNYNPIVEMAILTSPDKAANDNFGGKDQEGGFNIVFDGTATRLVVGCPNADHSSQTNNGAVYVFLRSGSTWAFEQKIVTTDAANDGYSDAIAIDSAGSRIAVGNFGNGVSGNANGGAVYIYSRSGTVWTQEQRIFPSGISTASYAGWAVDMTADGTRIIIGGPTHANIGGAWVYIRSGVTWTFEQSFGPNGALGSGTTSEQFGYAVSIAADGTRAAVASFSSGAACGCHIYSRSGSTWTKETKINNPWGGSGVMNTVCIDGTGTRVIFGDRNNDRAAVYSRSGTTWTAEITTLGAGFSIGSAPYFGQLVRINTAGDLIAVSAMLADTKWPAAGFNDDGGVYLFRRSGTTWTYQGFAEPSAPVANDNFGFTFGMSANGQYLAGGCPKRTVGGVTAAGQVPVFSS